ncbi:MAG: phosphate ABC transporter permease subunit PstC [Spirochaetota bacterium]|nr:phosphate ABC transporter permease subunit PstC [Spirochaetota bacterium]
MNKVETDKAAKSSQTEAREKSFARRGTIDKIFQGIVLAVAISAVVIIFLIFVFVTKEALPIFYDESIQKTAGLSKLFTSQIVDGQAVYRWQPHHPLYNVWPLIVGSIKVTLVAIFFGGPMAVAAAIYTSQFASKKLREVIKPAIEMLAGIPSVVLGFFAIIILSGWMKEALGLTERLNVFTAGVAMSFAVIPIIYTISEDALNSVPKSYSEASLALGATKIQTTMKVILPSVIPGIFAALVLGFGRAIGETMIVLMVSGNSPQLSMDFFESVRTLTATIAAEMGELEVGGAHYTVLFFLGAMLFTFTFMLNYIGDVVIHRVRRRLAGKN